MSIFSAIGGALKKVFGTIAPEIGTAASIGGAVVGVWNPALGAAISKFGTWVQQVETMYETAKQGAAKKQTVAQVAMAELPQLEAFISQFGVNAKIPDDELGKTIDAFAAAYNQAGAFIEKVKELNAPAKPA